MSSATVAEPPVEPSSLSSTNGVSPSQGVSVDPRPFWLICASHVINDVYPIAFNALVLIFTLRLDLKGWQIGLIYSISQILSGLPQGISAWATDRFDTRIAAPLGLFVSALCTGLMGFANSFEVLVALVAIAQIGNGIYHPTSAALSGQLGSRLFRHGRAMAVSVFFAAGMLGSILGPFAWKFAAITEGVAVTSTLPRMAWLIIPGALMAIVLFFNTGHLTHRHDNHQDLHASMSRAEVRLRWYAVAVLFWANAVRFIVNTGMIVLFPIWATVHLAGNVNAATTLTVQLIGAMAFGMGVAALFAARLVRTGHERGGIMLLSVLGAIATAGVGYAGSHFGMLAMYAAAAACSLGFAAILPITIGLAQRLLPGRTGLASGLMMGVSWSLAAFAAPIATLFLGGHSLNEAKNLPLEKIDLAFAWFGALLLLSGAMTLLLPRNLIRKVAEHK